jgi:MoxR-like ATPase
MTNALFDALTSEVVERAQEIHGLVLALTSGSHIFLLGPPGTGKSFMIDRAFARIEGANGFHILMGNFTGPADIEGPEDIAGLREGVRRRLAKGYLPEADWAFLDEIWKANDSILNQMLAAFNERKWRNAGEWVDIPLSVVACASNELPANDTLLAIYDRIPQRYQVDRIKEPANFLKMMELQVDPNPEKILTWEDVKNIQAEVRGVRIGDAVRNSIAEIRHQLFEEYNIDPSDRRFKQGELILKAEAWLEGCDEVEVDHVSALVPCLWDRPDQIADVEKVVLEKANPLQRQTLSLLNDIEKIGDTVRKAVNAKDAEERQAFGMESQKKARDAGKELRDLLAQASNSKKTQALVLEAKDRLRTHIRLLITEVFKLPEGAADTIVDGTGN